MVFRVRVAYGKWRSEGPITAFDCQPPGQTLHKGECTGSISEESANEIALAIQECGEILLVSHLHFHWPRRKPSIVSIPLYHSR